MLRGFSGHLISETFLERLVTTEAPELDERTARQLTAWRERKLQLGPASSVRAMLQVGAEPLLAAFGCEPCSDVILGDRSACATLRNRGVPATLFVAPWGERLDPLWREAATQALQRLTAWCLLFNGTHLRVVDTRRSFSRRYAEFELDQTLDDLQSISALRLVLPSVPLRSLVEASDHHADGVCRSLREGVLEASAAIYGALASPRARPDVDLDKAFEQALTIVYRLLFLLFAEARALVPVWHPIYRDSYSLDALRAAAERRTAGLWLFAPARTPLVDRKNLDDEAGRRAVLALSTRPSADRQGRERIAYRDLGVEQLGAVYETLLDYRPAADRSLRSLRPARVELLARSGLRKSTGTFYTPQPIAEYIVRRTLGPLVRDAEPERIVQLRVLDPAMGSGAFLVAACRYLASAYEAALVRSGHCHASDIDQEERHAIRRLISERCLYGVDLNPMAVQLARLSLWLTTLAADKPLSFLDHRLLVGNSLLGTWLGMLRQTPGRRQRRRPADPCEPRLFDVLPARDLLREMLPVRFSLESAPNDTVQQVRDKERALAALNARGSTLRAWRDIADLWCASWLAGDSVPAEAYGALSDAVLGNGRTFPGRAADRYLRLSAECSAAYRLFHWELEFPEVFFAADGSRQPDAGFDAVLSNPPWDMLRADEESRESPARIVRFTRDTGIYSAQSSGHANCYQLFAERAIWLTRGGGRVGLVLPAGLATDRGSGTLRRFLLTRCDVDTLVGFENRRGIFPIHRSIRFLLVTASAGQSTAGMACRFGVADPAELEAVGEGPAPSCSWFPVRLAPSSLRRLSGEGLSIPWLRTQTDLALSERAAALFPPLGAADGWSVRFGRELNATEDRRLLHGPGNGLPVVGGRQIRPFTVDLESSRWTIRRRDALARLKDARHTRPRLAYRDVAGAANQLTLIAAILPGDCICTHTVFSLRTPLTDDDQQFLCALFNSFVLNYLVRLRVATHVTTAMLEGLPVPTRLAASGVAGEIAALARAVSTRPDPRAGARLQAHAAALYQLTTEEFDYVLSTFPLVPRRQRDDARNAFRDR
jgi:N-6 DNA Methylase